MASKFGDAVTLVQKSRDGTFSRVNAIVLASVIQDAARPHLKAQDGKFLPAGEYLDLAVPRQFPDGHAPKARDMDSLFRPAYSVAPWVSGAWIGWQPGSATAVAPTPAPSAEDLDSVEAEKKLAAPRPAPKK